MRRLSSVVGVLLVLAACSSAPQQATGPTQAAGVSPSSPSAQASPSTSSTPPYAVAYQPDQFTADVTNPWFPLVPGTTLTYRGTKDEEKAIEHFTIANQVQRIDGVPCRVVLDRLFLNGVLAETTRDYYTQDVHGNVWYFGEDTAELDAKGDIVSTEGTWHTGESGALPGIFMPAAPRVGESHRQEYLVGHAEDFFQVEDLSALISVPYRSFSGAMLTKEWTPLEPGVLDHKFFVRGIGEVKEVTVKGPLEELMLVDVKAGPA
jgi:hypothetical protein